MQPLAAGARERKGAEVVETTGPGGGGLRLAGRCRGAGGLRVKRVGLTEVIEAIGMHPGGEKRGNSCRAGERLQG